MGVIGLALAMPAQAGLFDSAEYERPMPSGFAMRAALLNQAAHGRAALSDTALLALLDRVNSDLNRRPYVSDMDNYGVEDHWATPAEFEQRGGDCEDYVIAKYAMLKAMGVPAERMRLVVVRDLEMAQMHAVLSVAVGKDHYILDNQSGKILPDRAINRYRPVYSLAEHGWWLHMPTAN